MTNCRRASVKTRIVSFRRRRLPLVGVAAWLLAASPLPAEALAQAGAEALHVKQLEPQERETLQATLLALDPLISEKKRDGTANVLTWDELYGPLTPEQRAFLDQFRALKAASLGATSHFFGETANADLAPVGPQQVTKEGVPTPLDPQHLPRQILAAYRNMMDAMERDLGRRLLIESGYRSPAYQLYLFMYYMPKHDWSIVETNRFVALPGHSEHGFPPHQAIDFINESGINGEDHPEEFEALPEYRWLQQRAYEFGFVLSYPRNNPLNTAFEPWHWHYESRAPGNAEFGMRNAE